MLVIHLVRRIRRIPLPILLGLALMAGGALLDIVVHAGASGTGHSHGAVDEHLAHLVGITGMVLVLAGVVVHGGRRQRRTSGPQQGGFDRNAHR